MADSEDRPEVMEPYFVVEMPTEGGVTLFSDEEYKHESVRSLFAVVELNDLKNNTLWRTFGPRGLQVQALATAFLNTPGLYEAVGSMMDLLAHDSERKKGRE